MNTTIVARDYHPIMARGQVGYEAERGKIEPLGFAYLKASVGVLGLFIAAASEAFTLTLALHAQYPELSSGVDLGSEMLSMRYAVVAALMFGHVVVHDSPDQPERVMARWLRQLRLLPILAIIGSLAVFMFVATAQTTGGDDGQIDLAGPALGCACAALFSLSFLASNALVGKLLAALRSILPGWSQRAKVRDIARELEAADDCRARIETLRRDIAEREIPDVLRQRVAEEAAAIVGMVAAEAHEDHASREAVPDDLRPDDIVDLPDTPLATLDKRQSYLKSLNVAFFLNLLKNKEA